MKSSLRKILLSVSTCSALVALLIPAPGWAQSSFGHSVLQGLAQGAPAANSERAASPVTSQADRRANLLSFNVQVTEEVVPDLAVMTLAIEREGTDTAALTAEVNGYLTRALDQARATPGVVAASGGYQTNPRHDNTGKRTGWRVRAEIILKSQNFEVLGRLAGRLSSASGQMTINGNHFEVSPELRNQVEMRLLDRGAVAFRAKAIAAARAFGYRDYEIQTVAIGGNGAPAPTPRPLMRASAMVAEAGPVPLEGGRVTISLGVNGSVRMLR